MTQNPDNIYEVYRQKMKEKDDGNPFVYDEEFATVTTAKISVEEIVAS